MAGLADHFRGRRPDRALAVENLGKGVLTQARQYRRKVARDGEVGQGAGLRPGDQVGLPHQDSVQRHNQADSAEDQRRRDHRYPDQSGPGPDRGHVVSHPPGPAGSRLRVR